MDFLCVTILLYIQKHKFPVQLTSYNFLSEATKYLNYILLGPKNMNILFSSTKFVKATIQIYFLAAKDTSHRSAMMRQNEQYSSGPKGLKRLTDKF